MKFLSEHGQVKGSQISLFEMKSSLVEGCDNLFFILFMYVKAFLNSFITKIKQVMMFKSLSAEHVINKNTLEKFVSWPINMSLVCSRSVCNVQ